MFFFIYRCAIGIFAETFVRTLTLLGDAEKYQRARPLGSVVDAVLNLHDPISAPRVLSLKLTEALGTIFYQISLGNNIVINIGFQSIAFLGIYKILEELDPKTRLAILPIFMLPSFNLWSSVASKECIVVFAVCIISRYIVRAHRGEIGRFGFLEFLSFFLLYIYKNHYLPGILFVILSILVSRFVLQRSVVVLIGAAMGGGLLYVFREKIGSLALAVQTHWTLGDGEFVGRTTRGFFFSDQNDVFLRSPYGMFQGFFGPTYAEASIGILQLAAFIESSIIIAFLLYMFIRAFWRLPVYNFLMGVGGLFWILFATYPLSIMNPGSAVRYRTGYFVFVILIFVYLMARDTRSRGPTASSRAQGAGPPMAEA